MSSMVQGVISGVEPIAPGARRDQRFQTGSGEARPARAVLWFIVVLLGFVQAWSHRQLIDHDAVAYIDIADKYAHGQWSSAINGFYSPLYSWLMAIGIYLFHVPRYLQATLLHLVNFAGYLGAYACFELFLAEVIRGQRGAQPDDQATGLSDTAWHILGLGLFLYSTMVMANLSGHSGQGDPGSTPDIFVVLLVFLAAGLLMRMRCGRAQVGTYIVFGAALGFAYLAKTVMFPLSFVFMAVAGFISVRSNKRVLPAVVTIAAFALVVVPWIAELSHSEGRFTFGNAGRLTYRWLVGPRANPVEWGGQTEEAENLIHPPRRLSLEPPVYEFASPVAGTFPLWYGSSYWLAGWKLHFSPVGQLRIIRESYHIYWEILSNQREFLIVLLILVFLGGSTRQYLKRFLEGWVLWLPAVAALGLYALVRVEPRYVAPFVVMMWLSLFLAARLPRKDAFQQFARCAVFASILTLCAGIVRAEIADFHSILRGSPSEQSEVAAGLRKMGIVEGQALGTIGIPRDSYYWARLAGLRVIAEIPTPNVNQYWFASSETQEKVRSLFLQAGAVAIVTDTVPAAVTYPQSSVAVDVPGWERIGDTSYFLYRLRTEPSPASAAVTTLSHDKHER